MNKDIRMTYYDNGNLNEKYEIIYDGEWDEDFYFKNDTIEMRYGIFESNNIDGTRRAIIQLKNNIQNGVEFCFY